MEKEYLDSKKQFLEKNSGRNRKFKGKIGV